MCGRYTLSARKLALAEHALHCTFPELAPRYNIAPSQDVPIIRETPEGQYELVMVRWGLIPRWSKEPKTEYSTINARAETVAEKPAFRDAFRRRRCLIPADGFYEWKKEGTGKQPGFQQVLDIAPERRRLHGGDRDHGGDPGLTSGT